MSNDDPIGNAVGILYMEFYRLRKQNKYKEEYDNMGFVMDMLARSREEMREKYPEVIE